MNATLTHPSKSGSSAAMKKTAKKPAVVVPDMDPGDTTMLILGANGQLGYAVTKRWGELTENKPGQLLFKPRESLDISSREGLFAQLKSLRPNLVVNCAGFTNTTKAESDQHQCWTVNALGVSYLAAACSELEIDLVHISTDFVFGQDISRRPPQRTAYSEDDPVGATAFYGQSKVAAEHAILLEADKNPGMRAWIIRTAGLFEMPWRNTRNFPASIAVKLLRQRDEARVVSDVFTNICRADHLAEVICWLACVRSDWRTTGPAFPTGIYHIVNEGQLSWYDLATRIGRALNMPRERIVPTTRDEYVKSHGLKTVPASLCTCLNMGKYLSLGGPKMPDWTVAIDEWCEEARAQFG